MEGHEKEITAADLADLIGTQQYDWRIILDRAKPQGYLDGHNEKTALHGPVADIIVDGNDYVVITLKWAATAKMRGLLPDDEWESSKDKTLAFPNLIMPYSIEETPEKGPRIRFGTAVIYLNDVQGIDPARVKGLELKG